MVAKGEETGQSSQPKHGLQETVGEVLQAFLIRGAGSAG